MVRSANKQRHRVVKWPTPGSTACRHDHPEEQILVRSTVLYQSSWFQSSSTTHFILANEQAISPSQIQKHSLRGLTCCGIEGLHFLLIFSIIKGKPAATTVPTEPSSQLPQFFPKLALKKTSFVPCICIFSFLHSIFLLWERIQNSHLYKIMCTLSAQCLIL